MGSGSLPSDAPFTWRGVVSPPRARAGCDRGLVCSLAVPGSGWVSVPAGPLTLDARALREPG